MMTFFFKLMLAAIPLAGVVGEKLRARAFFDANNVKVGDPMVLTVDFIGEADFKSLHPPALSKAVDRRDWKLDDASAKTDTYRDARRLTYRVRPMREGVLWFPALEFKYSGVDGSELKVTANTVPVHAKGGRQVQIDMDEVSDRMPSPGELIREVSSRKLTDDEAFAWRKACADGGSASFRAFDFPEARLNEARALVLEGKWAEALEIYSRLEWTTGQTPRIEQGIVAALARKYDDPKATLPVWRELARPVLKFGWAMRLGAVAGALSALALLFSLVSKLLKLMACAAVATALVTSASAMDVFERMEAEMDALHRQMRQSMGLGGRFSGGQRQRRIEIKAHAATDRTDITLGDSFEFLISVEAPRDCSLSDLRLNASDVPGLVFTGKAENLTDGESVNPSNAVKRISVPARCDVPFDGKIAFDVSGMVTSRGENNRSGGFFSFTSSNSFQVKTPPVAVKIKALPESGKPDGFEGVVCESLSVEETLDLKTVETNDVVNITYTVRYRGFVPDDFMPQGSAFQIGRDANRTAAMYRRFFVADGAAATPTAEIKFFNPKTKRYETAKFGGTRIKYIAPSSPADIKPDRRESAR